MSSCVLVCFFLFHSKDLRNSRFRPSIFDNEKMEGSLHSYSVRDASERDSSFAPVVKAINNIIATQTGHGGASLAISRNGKVVYARGFGWADAEDSVKMRPDHILRCASVSKLITAVAVMKLVEEGKLSLSQQVFGPNGILNDEIYQAIRDKRTLGITVRNLLDHSGGWTNDYGDVMFLPYRIAEERNGALPVSIEDIIRFRLSRRLHFAPGAYSCYSNFGYAILGEVIAKVSMMPYEDYVRSRVFAPLGIYDAQLGQARKELRLPNEVLYYEQDSAVLVPDYEFRGRLSRRGYGGTDIHTLGAAGGWVISSVDLLKLILAIDGFDSVPDILSQESIAAMTETPTHLDPLGWRKCMYGAWFRTGTLSTTSAIACRRPDGINFVVIMNSSNYLGPKLAIYMSNKVNAAINKVDQWPQDDLLEGDFKWRQYVNN